jgi:hypothetical protein
MVISERDPILVASKVMLSNDIVIPQHFQSLCFDETNNF